MLILGLSGGLNRPEEPRFRLPFVLHDAAAVLVRDGEVIAAVEEERLNRIKHTNCFPEQAMRACLRIAGAEPADLNGIAFSFTEWFLDYQLRHYFLERQEDGGFLGARRELGALLEQALGLPEVGSRLAFVDHHLSHAASAFLVSGWDDALVVVIDGMGDNVSVSVYRGEDGKLTPLASLPVSASLGMFYLAVIHTLGYGLFDEYKVMGLAPYGDPAKHRGLFQTFYELHDEGGYLLRTPAAEALLGSLTGAQDHDVAATLQETLETVALHMLAYYQKQTGLTRLCLAGGVAHNCTLNGKLAAAGLFDSVFVQPAAHDAGGALGAALMLAKRREQAVRFSPLRHVYLGRPLGEVASRLVRWAPVITVEPVSDPAAAAADLLASGAVIGWVQGRSEFGPRALGNRSILADPRPAQNRDVINSMVKKREAYRPFAPAVPEEDADRFFDIPAAAPRLPFMTFVVGVRPEVRSLLGAVTHVDGTARVQTVAREDNELFWRLLREFGARTGVPVLLNTSFNNNAEPIVDSLDDAVACFLTSGLTHLVAGSFVVTRSVGETAVEALVLMLPAHVTPLSMREPDGSGKRTAQVYLERHYGRRPRRPVSEQALAVLVGCDDRAPLGALLDQAGLSGAERAQTRAELIDLWSRRLVFLAPP
jgi:carbamoyltransferase